MEIRTEKELIKELDEMNKDGFKYVGVYHNRSGYRPMVESFNKFIEDLGAKPVREIKIRNPPNKTMREIEKYSIVMQVSPAYVNIYKVEDVKDKIGEASKEKSVLILRWIDNSSVESRTEE